MIIFVLIVVIVYTLILRKKFLKYKTERTYYRDIPSKDSPAIVGKIVKGHIDGNDIIATILDLSYKGYIKIEIEQIKGKEKMVLYLDKHLKTTELQEHELFLIKQIFKNNNRILFDDYIKSAKFKQDFKTFDKMLERRVGRQVIKGNSSLKNVNKTLLLLSYVIFGVCVFYSLITPIVLLVNNLTKIDTNTTMLINVVISIILYLLLAYKYILHIEKSTNARENIILKITFIILSLVFGVIIIFNTYNNVLNIFYNEFVWYEVIINFITSLVTILYMFNIIKHNSKEEYLYYIFIIISLFSIILNMKITMGISIIFFIAYIFFQTPKHNNLKDNEYIQRWRSFKNYIEDYSMLSVQEENAITIWEKYLIYAIVLGVNKEIIKKYAQLNNIQILNKVYLKRLYIEYFE